jgi:hypothetical protein
VNPAFTAVTEEMDPHRRGQRLLRIKNVNSGLNAGVAQSSTVDGASVVQWNDLNVDDQLWKIVRIN